MDPIQTNAALIALEAATDALLVAAAKVPEPDLEAVQAALNARESALRFLARADPNHRPADADERFARILERDARAMGLLGQEMEATSSRLKELAAARTAARSRVTRATDGPAPNATPGTYDAYGAAGEPRRLQGSR